ncbi:metallophosphoesterase [Anaerocolumna xylanovorans]|uniref:UDP-2,3-diacylglucosamine pyrophosphatase LpxH n=1 Tax=Anaerocolumna xylanovorans DSM 12503 TaxID=1121345 RepID=A0A1M7YN51_9FIRM|nr:metallophosphoesterase [Anaerocolumna xylanovorans]SHO54039.1 UDP-2,3-diacylglucosamine pyrophosphatase LpxH [Anaerocolumna xylanovorans DSM 12503]
MYAEKRLNKAYVNAEEIPINKDTKIVLISDCHRGIGNWGDNLFNNQNLYFAALNYYYENNYIYIELGDGDELWENRSEEDIIATHSYAFWMMSRFYESKRFYMLYGNHDIVKRNPAFAKDHFTSYFNESYKKTIPLLPDIRIREALVLRIKNSDHKILLVHGHQADFFNNTLWRLARFLVRYLWRPFELIGVKDPTSASKNYNKKEKIEKYMMEWAKKNQQMLIAGHTHRPAFPALGEPLYFNDGSCVHPRCITSIEIENEMITLVKWSVTTRPDRTLYVERTPLEGPVPLLDFFSA